MATYTETIALADTVVGDRWVGISEITPTVNEATPDNDLVRVRMEFRLGQTVYVLDSLNGDIVLDDPNGWSASIPARDDFLPRSGKWSWTMFFYQSGVDSPWALYSGQIVCHANLG